MILYWLLCLLIALIPTYFIYKKDKKKNIPIKWLPAFLRFLTIFLTLVLLLLPAIKKTQTIEEKPVVVWLQDQSESITKALTGKDSSYINLVEQLWNQWESDYHLVSLGFGGKIERAEIFNYNQKTTNIAQAVQQVIDQYEERNLSAIILSSDGNFNEGMNPLHLNLNKNIPIYTIALGDSTQIKDASVSRIYANKKVALHSNFEIMADIQAVKLSGLRTEINLINNGEIIDRLPVHINNDQFSSTVKFEINAEETGFHNYAIGFATIADDQNEHNNQQNLYVEVVEESLKILLLAASPHPDIQAIKSALADRKDYKLDVEYVQDGQVELELYDLIIAHQVPNAALAVIPATKPVWYILGNLSNIPVFNNNQNAISIEQTGNANAVLPILEKGFNAFEIPRGMENLINQLPPMNAISGNYIPTGNNQVLFRQKIGQVQTEYPLWMITRTEVPKAILAGTGLWRWRMNEYRINKSTKITDELIRQTVSLLRKQNYEEQFNVYVNDAVFNEHEPISIFANLRNRNYELTNSEDVILQLTDSTGKVMNYNFQKQGNSYYLNLGLLSAGPYSFIGKTTYDGKDLESKGVFQVNAINLEELKSNSDYALLYNLSSETGGSFFTISSMPSLTDSLQNNQQVKPLLSQEDSHVNLIDFKWYFFLILGIATIEWLLRKFWSI